MSTSRTDGSLSLADARAATGSLIGSRDTIGPWLVAVVAVDALLVLITVVSELYPETLVVRRFNLSVEHTIGVWWSAMTLALAAVLVATGDLRGRARLGGYAAGALLLGLSLDELASLHERAPQGAQLLALAPFALAGGVTLLFTLASWFPHRATRPSAVLLALGFACFGSVVGQEILEHAVTWPVWAIGLRTGVEEGIELVGIFLCLLAGLRLRGPACAGHPGHTLFRVDDVPRPLAIAASGLALHVVAAFVAPRLGGYPSLGNPAMWFPTVAYGLAAAMLVGRLLRAGRADAVALGLVAVFALLSAVHAVFIYPESELDKLVWRNVAGAGAGLLALLLARREPRPVLAIHLLPLAALAAFLASASAETAFLVAGGERLGGARHLRARSRPDRPGARRGSPSREAPGTPRGPGPAPPGAPLRAAQGRLRAARCGRR